MGPGGSPPAVPMHHIRQNEQPYWYKTVQFRERRKHESRLRSTGIRGLDRARRAQSFVMSVHCYIKITIIQRETVENRHTYPYKDFSSTFLPVVSLHKVCAAVYRRHLFVWLNQLFIQRNMTHLSLASVKCDFCSYPAGIIWRDVHERRL